MLLINALNSNSKGNPDERSQCSYGCNKHLGDQKYRQISGIANNETNQSGYTKEINLYVYELKKEALSE